MDKDVNDTIERIVAWLRKKIGEAGAKGAIVGLSGGVDSSVVAALAKRAFGDDMLGIMMPCHSEEEDSEHARML
ncbi:MAG: NAD(+) synthetase, partial [Thermoplasmata archaeon]|nr:NAD(+) synthetase [Thermoplasmata archaeon]